MKFRSIDGTEVKIGGRETALVLLISALAFLCFYGTAYFSEDFQGMLGYELKDTLCQLMSHFRALDQGSTLFWDPDYLQYTPRFPQAPLHSPVTLGLMALHKVFGFADRRAALAALLAALAAIQILCAYTFYLFLKYCGLDFTPSILGSLGYAYNHQTLVFGIRHGYDRISAFALAPLFLLTFFQALQDDRPRRRRWFVALSGLLLGIALIANGDVKPTFFFCLFMGIAALLYRPFRLKNLAVPIVIFALAGGIFLVHGMPTLYAFGEMGRGQEPIDSILDFSLSPIKLLQTHVSTGFTDRPDYPWENTAEFSLSLLLLAVLGLFHLPRHRLKWIIPVALVFSYVWVMGKYSPLAPLQGAVMKLFGVRHPRRMMTLAYFCYAFLAALGAQNLSRTRYNRAVTTGLFLLPLSVLFLYLRGEGAVPLRYLVLCFLSYSVLCAVVFGNLSKKLLWLIVLFFLLERTTIFSTLKESNRGDPTEYYTYSEIYRSHPRVEPVLRDPGYREFKAFFGAKEFDDLFSHNLYLNALTDNLRPIFPYLYFWDHEMKRTLDLQAVIFSDWSNPMWDLLNVKYFVDLDRHFAAWDEEDTSKVGLDHLQVIDERVRVNPGAEEEIFVRYRAEPVGSDGSFLEMLKSGEADVKNVAYLNDPEGSSLGPPGAVGEEVVSIISRKPDEITAEVTVPTEAVIVFSEFWFFPWRAEVDGEAAELSRAYNVLQAVRIGEGTHRVRFYFNSRHWKFVLPFVVSYGLMLCLVFYIVYWHRRRDY